MNKKMKEFAIGLCGWLVIISGFLFASYLDCHYSMECTVIEHNNEMCFKDKTNQVWSDDRANNYEIGDNVTVVFDTNCTDNTRYDDKVFKIK